MTLGACFWYLSLALTTVSINTGIYNSSFVLVYLLRSAMLMHKINFNSLNLFPACACARARMCVCVFA